MVEQVATPTEPAADDSIDPGGFVPVGPLRSSEGGSDGRYGRRPVPAVPSTASDAVDDREGRAAHSARDGAARAGRRTVVVERGLQGIAAAWAVLVVVLSLIPDDPSAPVAWDKARHGGAYAVLTALVLVALVWRPGRRLRSRAVMIRTAAAVALAIVVLGGVIEVLQAEVVDRDGSGGDLLADAIGVVVAGAAWAGAGLLARRRRRTRRRLATNGGGARRSFESRTNHPQ